MNETNFNFITSQRAYGVKYLQFPEVLLYGEKYRDLSDSAKLAYMVLQNRLSYSLQNNWVDTDNRVYFIFTNQELHNLFGWGSAKVVRIKKELEQKGLLFQINQGFDPKQKKNLPNRLYLADLEVTAKDVYIKQGIEQNTAQTSEPQDIIKMKPRDENNSKPKTSEPQDIIKMKPRDESAKSLEPSDIIKMKHNLYNNNIDTKKIHEDTQLNFSENKYSPEQIEKQNTDLLNHLPDLVNNKDMPPFLNQESAILIKSWCKTPKEVYRFVQIILNAKKAVTKNMTNQGFGAYTGLLDLENLTDEMPKWLRNYFNRIRTVDTDSSKRITNYEGYLYTAMVNNLNTYVHSALASQE
ncbi:plasmid replication initiation protein [Lactobacillus sp. ESL0233]|uniref:replication initiator protein A n=1 Tax=Lactobacillus sp. ESL0233 TaxID=2069354 RepID=UPI000EFC0781|nr:replication initiator protein A [Lactobacillus sp. ESL0233]RMC39064.1 plasmid replication initiation protein [Lactobacillus sp. ESL0233]